MEVKELLKENNRLKGLVYNYEAEIKGLRKLILDKYGVPSDDVPRYKAEMLGKLPFMNDYETTIYKISLITGINVQDIKGKSRVPSIITARFACYWALSTLHNCNFSFIGRLFNVHHSSVMHGITAFTDRADFKHNIEYHLIKEIMQAC